MRTLEDTPTCAVIDARSGAELELVMQELQLTGRLLCAGAILNVRHVFRFEGDGPVEVIYAFALPRDAALRRFRVVGSEFSVESELKAVEEAVKRYEEGIGEGSLSTLVRLYRDGLVNLSLGNLQPAEEVAVCLELVAGVDLRDDGFRFRFPLTLAPSYHPRAVSVEAAPGTGETLLPESTFGDVMLPHWRDKPDGLHSVGLRLSVTVPGEIQEIASPSHNIRVQSAGPGQARVQLSVASDVPNRDLVLDCRGEAAAAYTVGARSADGDGRFFAAVPSTSFGTAVALKRKLIFVLDRSGSMGGDTMTQAKRAVRACLAALSDQDEFGLLAFDNELDWLSGRLLTGTGKNRRSAEDFLGRIDARGGTELGAALREACGALPTNTGDVFLVTDGQVFETEQILNSVRSRGVRVHCLGIGSASQDRFLSLLSRGTEGVCRFVTPRERVDLAAAELFAGIKSPVARQLEVTLSRSTPGRIIPQSPRTVFEGSPLAVWGQVSDAAGSTLGLTWQAGEQTRKKEIRLALENDEELHKSLKTLHGARLLTDMDSRVEGEPTPSQREALSRLSRQYGLASRSMALVAVVKRQGDRPGDLPTTRVVPVGMPQDTAFESYFSRIEAKSYLSGVEAMEMSVAAFPLEELSAPPSATRGRMGIGPFSGTIRRIGDRFRARVAPGQEPAPGDSGSPEPPVAIALEIVSRIESDGGMPGDTVERRVLRSLIALLGLGQLRDQEGTSAFDPHIDRLMDFCTREAVSLKASLTTVTVRLVEEIRQGEEGPEGDWISLLRELESDWTARRESELWDQVSV